MTSTTVDNVLGESFTEKQVPSHPARIFWRGGTFLTEFPHAPVVVIEVRFRKAHVPEEGDFTVCEARKIDTSEIDAHGEWQYE